METTMRRQVGSRFRAACRATAPVALGVLLAVAGGLSSKAWAAQTVAHYRFEEGSGTDVFDTKSGTVHGQLIAGATFSVDRPLVKGMENHFSADFTTGGGALITGTTFIFHDPQAGGAVGDATFEWFMKVPVAYGHNAIFWTNKDAGFNNFHIFWNCYFTGAPDSDRFISGDYSAPGGVPGTGFGAPGHNSGNPLSLNEWHHVAIVRRDLGAGATSGSGTSTGSSARTRRARPTHRSRRLPPGSWPIGRAGSP